MEQLRVCSLLFGMGSVVVVGIVAGKDRGVVVVEDCKELMSNSQWKVCSCTVMVVVPLVVVVGMPLLSVT